MKQNNNQSPAEIVAIKMAERMKQSAVTDDKRKGVLVIIDDKPPVADNTTLMLYTVKLRAVDEQKPTAYFPLNRSDVEVVNQFLAITTGIGVEKISAGQLSDDEWDLVNQKLPLLMDAPLYIDATTKMTLKELKRKAEELSTEKGVSLMVIDHAQMMTVDGMPANSHRILANIKAIAENLCITIIAVLD